MAPTTPQMLSSFLRCNSSPELGSPSFLPQYNKKTGRPIRRGAGQKKASVEGYIDSAIIEDEDFFDGPSEDDDDEIVKYKRVAKRKRSPSPTPPPLEPIIYDEPRDGASDDESGMFRRNTVSQPILLQFNVPLGYHGPLIVKIDRDVLQQSTSSDAAQDLRPRQAKKSRIANSMPEPEEITATVRRTGFTDLPPELRNKVYRHVFVCEHDLKIPGAKHLCRSGQFLCTCKLVHSEGCSILYGENRFAFDRNVNTRAPFWDPVPKEIGYKDIRQFLKMIGPENLVYLRDLKFTFNDASPSATPYLKSNEGRRYLNDEHLFDCLRILRQAKLRNLCLRFFGRRTLLRTDVKFLGYLEQLKADEVSCIDVDPWYLSGKIPLSLWENLKETMTRKRKLYSKE